MNKYTNCPDVVAYLNQERIIALEKQAEQFEWNKRAQILADEYNKRAQMRQDSRPIRDEFPALFCVMLNEIEEQFPNKEFNRDVYGAISLKIMADVKEALKESKKSIFSNWVTPAEIESARNLRREDGDHSSGCESCQDRGDSDSD